MLLEAWSYMNTPSKLDAPISSKQFFGLKLCFQCSMWYICLNLIDLSKKSTFCLFKTKFKAKKLFARNRGIQLRRASVKVSILQSIFTWSQLQAYLQVGPLMRRCFAHIESSSKVERVWLCLKQLAASIHAGLSNKQTFGHKCDCFHC